MMTWYEHGHGVSIDMVRGRTWCEHGHGLSTDITGELWVTLRGKFCDQLNDCQLVRHQLIFNYTDKESTSVQILIPSATTTLPLPKLCESVWFENNAAAVLCFGFCDFFVQRVAKQ